VLLTIERVLLLKGVEFFATTGDAELAAVAAILEEEEWPAGSRIIAKGDAGSSMYILAGGAARVHDGDLEIATLRPGQVFGELSALVPMPRSASITALEDVRLLRLEHEALFELMADHVEVAHGIIRYLVATYGRRRQAPGGATS
jgi:CRP-like cAMP-binding protein